MTPKEKLKDQLRRGLFLSTANLTPKNSGDDFHRASGACVCECGFAYRDHPYSEDDVSFDGQLFLKVLCDGTKVKL